MFVTKQTYIRIQTILNVCGIKRAVVWTLSVNAIGILKAFVHFNILTLFTFDNV